MKKLFLSLLCVVLASSAVMAQETQQKPSFKGFRTNGFWDNWELSAGIGVNTAASTVANDGGRGDRLGFDGSISATKWIVPVVGFRAQLQGGKFSTYENADQYKWPYLFAHGDLMLNLSNWIGGYREDRLYSAVPYLGIGWLCTNFTDDSQAKTGKGRLEDFALAYGLVNKFRVSKALDVDLELKGFLVRNHVVPHDISGKIAGLSATIGVTYRFNNRGWERALDPVATAAELASYQKAAADSKANWENAQADNARMAKDLDAARKDAADAKAQMATMEAELADLKERASQENASVMFNLNSSTISSKEATRLEVMADVIKNGPSDRVYTVYGHADAQTGTPEINQRVAEKRAKSVYDYLVKLGVNPDQLKYESRGDKEAPYNVQKANRAAIIK